MDDKSGLNKKSQIRATDIVETGQKSSSKADPVLEKTDCIRKFFSTFFEENENLPTFKKLFRETLTQIQDICTMLTEFQADVRSAPAPEFRFSVFKFREALAPLMGDPIFRKNILIQCKILVHILDNKVAAFRDRYQELGKDDRRLLSKTEDLINQASKQVKVGDGKCTLQEVLSKLSFNERKWIEWKNNNCNTSIFGPSENESPVLGKR